MQSRCCNVSRRELTSGQLTPTERDILLAFGNALIEFEVALYYKFLVTSAQHSIITKSIFKRILHEMEAKGYLSSLLFQGRRVWRKEVISVGRDFPLKGIDIAKEAKIAAERGRRPLPRPGIEGRLVTDTHVISADLLESIEKTLRYHVGPARNEIIRKHIREMQKALMHSDDAFLEYVQDELPVLLPSMKRVLQTRGQDFLLVSLRLMKDNIDSKIS